MSYGKKLAVISTHPQNYAGENWDDAMSLCVEADTEIAELEAQLAGQEYPQATCPKCGHEFDDMDGFGFIYCEKCKHCTHPNSMDGVCGICGIPIKEVSND